MSDTDDEIEAHQRRLKEDFDGAEPVVLQRDLMRRPRIRPRFSPPPRGRHRFIPPPPEIETPLPDLIPRYEAARAALAEALTLDEVGAINQELDQLRASGRITADFKFELMLAELKVRAFRQLGIVSEGLAKSKGGRGKTSSDDGNSFKLATLERYGISRSAAYRAEKVAHIEPRRFEQYLAQCRADGRPITVNDLIDTVCTRVQAVELDDSDVEAMEAQLEQRDQADARAHGIDHLVQRRRRRERGRVQINKVLQIVERDLSDNTAHLIELALVAASSLPVIADRDLLRRLLNDDVLDKISRLEGHRRTMFIERLRQDGLFERRDQELGKTHSDSMVRSGVKARRAILEERTDD